MLIPGLSLRSNPGLEVANAFGVTEKERLWRYVPFPISNASALKDVGAAQANAFGVMCLLWLKVF
jgi:predicted outer membrane lipoprotein